MNSQKLSAVTLSDSESMEEHTDLVVCSTSPEPLLIMSPSSSCSGSDVETTGQKQDTSIGNGKSSSIQACSRKRKILEPEVLTTGVAYSCANPPLTVPNQRKPYIFDTKSTANFSFSSKIVSSSTGTTAFTSATSGSSASVAQKFVYAANNGDVGKVFNSESSKFRTLKNLPSNLSPTGSAGGPLRPKPPTAATSRKNSSPALSSSISRGLKCKCFLCKALGWTSTSDSECDCSDCDCSESETSSDCDSIREKSAKSSMFGDDSSSKSLQQKEEPQLKYASYDEDDPLLGASGYPKGSEQDIAFRASALSKFSIPAGTANYHLYRAGRILRDLALEDAAASTPVETNAAGNEVEMAEVSSVPPNTRRKIRLESQEGVVIEADMAIMMKSGMIKSMVENLGDRDNGPITLPSVSTDVLVKLVSWANHHKDDPPVNPKKKIKAKRTYNISSWDREFFRGMELSVLNGLMLASNYLDITDLLHLTCQVVAELVHDMTEEEIREAFHLDNDIPAPLLELLRGEDVYL